MKFLVRIAVVLGLVKIAGMLAGELYEQADDPAGDQFDLLAVADGIEFHSTSPSLRRGTVRVALGGADVDLRRATLSTDGADLDAFIVGGGIRILCDPAWNVVVHSKGVAGGVAVDVGTDLPADAPQLRIKLGLIGGGAAIATAPSSRHVVHQQGDPA